MHLKPEVEENVTRGYKVKQHIYPFKIIVVQTRLRYHYYYTQYTTSSSSWDKITWITATKNEQPTGTPTSKRTQSVTREKKKTLWHSPGPTYIQHHLLRHQQQQPRDGTRAVFKPSKHHHHCTNIPPNFTQISWVLTFIQYS